MTEPRDRHDVTLLLASIAKGDQAAGELLLGAVYDELHRLAQAAMRAERPAHTLQPTALVHDAYVALVGKPDAAWDDRRHFFGAAARAMRQVLTDWARRGQAAKRGGDRDRVAFTGLAATSTDRTADLVALAAALDRLEAKDTHLARIVELRYFAGLTIPQTAEVLAVSEATVKRGWAYARAWLFRELERDGVDAP